ncbi:type I polyketide synthase, partial [Streptomyces sp. NPDC087850]|uniref:type I polyketide synthase n=1 Tax=Streptomyces sp. NPDC087850 TaxID=3365809 RepID=UPI003800B5D1
LLVSRSGPEAPGAVELLAELEELGARATIVACDVADRQALEGLLAGIPAEHPLTAVFHTAGILGNASIDELTPERIDAVFAPKADAALHLHELTAELDLSAFVLFSSGAGIWGSAGQAGYAAANAFLDALAEHRRAQGLTATAIAWGPWAEAGMLMQEADGEDGLRRRGVTAMLPAPAIGALQRALELDDTTVTVADIDWARFGQTFTVTRPSPLIEALAGPAPETLPPSATAHGAAAELLGRLTGRTAAEQNHLLTELVCRHTAVVLGLGSAAAVERGRPFKEAGFDSLMAVEFRNRLTEATGTSLPTTLVFDYPTPAAVVQCLFSVMQLDDQVSTVESVNRPMTTDEPIAIVGMACRFPGAVRTPEELWSLVRAGADVVGDFPEDRGWEFDSTVSFAHKGGFLYDAGEFDAGFFGISPREALAMDPQQRLLLETAWETFEHAGLDPLALSASPTGVFVGAALYGYDQLIDTVADGVEGHLVTGAHSSVMSGRLSYALGLEGPAVTVDTACSSSLVSLHLAVQALRSGECDLALAGGVTVMSTPTGFIEFAYQGGLAADGRCKAFSADADGTGWSEGVGLLLVERLSDA